MLLKETKLSGLELEKNKQCSDSDAKPAATINPVQALPERQTGLSPLQLSEQRLKDFASASSDWFWEIDAEGRFIWFSDNFEEIFGLSPRDYYGKKRQEIADTTFQHEHWQRYFAALRHRQPFKDIIFHEHTKKGWCWNRISGVPVFSVDGDFQGYRGTGSDVTELYDAQDLAEQAKQQFIDAIEAFSDAYALFDAAGRLVICNRKFKEYNQGLEALIKPGMLFETLVRARLDRRLMVPALGCEEAWLSERLEHFNNPRGALEIEQTDGSWLSIREERTQDGGLLFIATDITERKQAEQALKQSEERLEMALTGADLATWDWDITTDRAVFDQRWAQMLGYTLAEINGRPGIWQDSIHEDDKARAFATISAQTEGRSTTTYELEHRLKTKTGQWKWILARGRAMARDETGKAIRMMGTHLDITERKRAEEALRSSEQRFKDFAETAADWFWEMDEHLTIRYLSERYFELTGEAADAFTALDETDIYAMHITGVQDRHCFRSALRLRQPFSNIQWLYTDCRNRKVLHFILAGRPFYDNSGQFKGFRGTGRDITDAKRLEEKLSHQASHDALTGLINRHAFEQLLDRSLALARSYSSSHVLCYIDLDQFKIVNDTVGHHAGDQLLQQVAVLIGRTIRHRDTAARLGGDEFGLLLSECSMEEARHIADRLIRELSELRFPWEGHLFEIGASIGMVEVSREAKDINELMAQADIACYAAKDQGRNRTNIYHADDAELTRRHDEILRAAGIREALKRNRFCLYAQSIEPLKKSGPSPSRRYEILLRLYDDDGGLLTPGAFIPAAERYGLMGSVDRWVIQTTLENFTRLFTPAEHVVVSINLSGNSLNDEGLLDFVLQQISRSVARPEQICFEITETAFISNLTQASRFISEMKTQGCRFALDDFGSGLSSFAYLKNFPVDYLKIDGSFIRDIATDPADYAMVAAINQVGHALGIETIAEFVETDVIIEILSELGVDYIQGYAVDRPGPLPPLTRQA